MKTLLRSIAVASTLLATQTHASAWDGVITGVVFGLHSVPQAGNYDLRVVMAQGGSWCGPNSASGWAGLNSNEPNFKGVQATLMLAYAMGKTTTIYLTRDASNYCKIGYVEVSG